MTDFLLLLYPIGLFVLTFWGCKYAGKGNFCENLWDQKQGKMLQAYACLSIILHHVTQLVTGYGAAWHGPITLYDSLGILFTSIFFFFSGYGLMISVLQKPDYLDGFLLHRLPVVLLPFFLANIISVLIRLFYLRIPTTTGNIVKAIFGFVLLNGNGWFVVEIFFLYHAFYLSFKFIRQKDIAMLVLILATVFVISIGFNNGHDSSTVGDHWFMGEWWYNATIVFIMGILFARFREKILAFTKKHYLKILIITAVLSALAYFVEEFVRACFGYYRESTTIDAISNKGVTLLAQMILCLLCTWLVLLINMKISIGNKVLSFLGKISMEVFLLHGLFVRQIFSFKNWNICLIYLAVLVCGILSGFALYLIDRPMIAWIQSLGAPKDYIKDCEDDLFRRQREAKKKRIKTILLFGIMAAFVGYFSAEAYTRLIRTPIECKKEIRALSEAKIGDLVYLGRYESDLMKAGKERVSWIVLDQKDGAYLLLSQKGLAGSVYDPKHRAVSWEDASLQEYLNETMLDAIFSEYEKNYIVENPETSDMLSLLSVSQAEKYFAKDADRQLALTNAAISYGTNVNVMSKANNWDNKGYRSSWWWLRGDQADIIAPIVTVDGTIRTDDKYVNKPNGAVRPVVWVKLP